MPHNRDALNKTDLLALIKDIDSYAQQHYDLYALGGTALTLRDIKDSTLDVDINIPEDQKDALTKLFEKLGFQQLGTHRWRAQEGFAFDLFTGNDILGTHLPDDTTQQAHPITTYQHITLYALSNQDIIISKLTRGDDRDFADIKTILEHQTIDLHALTRRYQQTMQDSVVAQHKQKLLDLIEIKLPQWGFEKPQELIKEVKQWPER